MGPDGESRLRADLLTQLGWVQRLARAIVRDGADADDLAQEVVRVALERREPIVGAERGLRAWLRRVARTLALDRARAESSRRARERAVSRPERTDSPSEVVERGWRQQRVAQAVLELSEPYRTTVLLRYLDELSIAEIARRTAASEATTRQRLARGLQLLRARLDRELGCDSHAWALALLAGQRTGAPSTWSGVLLKGVGLMGAKWLAAAAIVIAVGWIWWQGTTESGAPAEVAEYLGSVELAERSPERVQPPSEPDSAARAPAGGSTQAGAGGPEPATGVTILRVRVESASGASLVAGRIDCGFARERDVANSPSTVRARVPIDGEVTEIRLPTSAVAARLSASVAGARASSAVMVAPLRPADAAASAEVVHDVRIEVDEASAPPALVGAILVDGVRRAPKGLDVRYSADHVLGEQPRVNTLDASYALEDVAPSGGRLWVTSDETTPRNFALDAGVVRSGELDLELDSGRTLALTLLDRAEGTPLAHTSFHLRRYVRLFDNVFDQDQRTFTTDEHGRCEITGVQASGDLLVLPDCGPAPRAMIMNGSEPWTMSWLNEPWWMRRLRPDDPQRIEVTLRVTLQRDGASAFGWLPPSLRGGRERSERVTVAARELNPAFDPQAPPAERLAQHGDAFELPVDAQGRWVLRAPFPSRYAVWLERSASRAKLSAEVEVALDAAGEVGPIELPLLGGLPIELRLERVPERGRVSVSVHEPSAQPRLEQVVCAGGSCSHTLRLARAAELVVTWSSNERHETSISRSLHADPSRDSELRVDFGEALARSLELAPIGLELRGEEVLMLRRLDRPERDVVQVPLRDGRSIADAALGAGRWLYAYGDRAGSALILGVVELDAASTRVRLAPAVVATPRAELGERVLLHEVDGVSLEALFAPGRPMPVPGAGAGGEGSIWLNASLRYERVP